MFEPYKMVYVNIFLISIVGVILLAYRFIYPKRKFPYFFALILLAFPPIFSILRFGTYESGDLSLHSKFAIDFFQNLSEGIFIPQWAKHICVSFGCPNFLYMYPFPYYAISLLHLLGFSFIASIKAYLMITYVLSGVFMYLFVRDEVDKRAGFISAIFYLYAPYHLVDLHFRITIAEMASFMLLPLVFYLLRKMFYSFSFNYFILLSLSVTFLILSHQAIITAALPLFILYIIYSYLRKGKIKFFYLSLISLLFGFLCTSFYWVPILIEKQYIYFGNYSSISFPHFYEFLYSPWRFGLLLQGPEGQLSFIIGYIQILLLIYGVYLYKKKGFGKHSVLFISSLCVFIFIFLMMQSFTRILWEYIPLIKSFQFSYRLLVISALSLSIFIGVLSTRIRSQKIYLVVIAVAIASTILNWGNRRVIPEINDAYLRQELYSGDPGHGDLTTPQWVNLNRIDSYPLQKERLIVLEGKASIKQIADKTTYHSFVIQADTPVLFRENTFYYPNWSVQIDKKDVAIDIKNKGNEGTLVFKAPEGVHFIEVSFTNTETRSIFLKVSIISFILLFLFPLVFPRMKKSVFKT